MAHFVVAVEFEGADLPPLVGGARTPVREHAFDLDTGSLMHDNDDIRVGFPEPGRGWPAARASLCCPRCDAIVSAIISARIRAVLLEHAGPLRADGSRPRSSRCATTSRVSPAARDRRSTCRPYDRSRPRPTLRAASRGRGLPYDSSGETMTSHRQNEYDPPLGSDDASSATQQAADAAQAGKDAATDVATTAADAAKNVAQETSEQARDLLGKTKSQVNEQIGVQQQSVIENLRSLGDQLAEMTDRVQQQGTAVDLAGHARDRVRGAADWLDGRNPAEILDELRKLGRNKPGGFLLGATVAGVAAGRLTRGVVAVHTDDADSTTQGLTAGPVIR